MIFGVLTVVYAAILIYISLGMSLNRSSKSELIQSISVIIAAKNEEHRLPYLIRSLSKLDYPPEAFEIIIVNDHSTDATQSLLDQVDGQYGISVIHYYDQVKGLIGKKAAIAQGIAKAKYDILAFTDADCSPPSGWLRAISNGFDDSTDYMLGYTFIETEQGQKLMTLRNFERCIYYVLAAAGMYWRIPITSSASNMIYRKKVFHACGGFDGIGDIKSGDDDLLLFKMMPYIRKATFNTDIAMEMLSVEPRNIHKQYNASIRKASKWRYFPAWLKLTSVFIGAYFILSYVIFAALLTGAQSFLLPLAIKSVAEISMIILILLRLRKFKLIILYPLMLAWYPLKFLYFGIRGTLGKYSWK